MSEAFSIGLGHQAYYFTPLLAKNLHRNKSAFKSQPYWKQDIKKKTFKKDNQTGRYYSFMMGQVVCE